MAESEEQQNQEQSEQPEDAQEAPEAAAEETPAEEPAAEETPAEEPVAEEPAAEEPAAEEPAAAPAPAEAPAAEEPGETLSPRQQRKAARSRFEGEARPPRTPEERLVERASQRRRKAGERSRWRKKQRTKHAARDRGPAAEQPGPSREPGSRKVRQGVVVSSKGEKTITVRLENVRRHRLYEKVLRESNTLHAHDEANEANEGDVVRVVECRPLSRTKRWRLVEVLEKAR